jgi:hypothetical protein
MCFSPYDFGAPFFAGFAFNSTLNSTLPIHFKSSRFSSLMVKFSQAALQVKVADAIVSPTGSRSIRVFRISLNGGPTDRLPCATIG